MSITVIIPTFNEEKNIGQLVNWLKETGDSSVKDIIVTDGGSKDQTVEWAKKAGATVLLSPEKGRAAQMNHGAKFAKSDILYFVHADVLPPKTWVKDITDAVKKNVPAGCFSFKFDSNEWHLKVAEWASRQDWFAVGGGDQTMFVKKEIFDELNGFDAALQIMEDFDFVKRLRKKHPFKIIFNDATISARKYKDNSFVFIQTVNVLTVFLFNMGFPQKKLAEIYRRALKVR